MDLETLAICILIPVYAYLVAWRRNSEILSDCEWDERRKSCVTILSREEVLEEFGLWVIPRKQYVREAADFLHRIMGPILLLSALEALCWASALFDGATPLLKRVAHYAMLGFLVIQFVILMVNMMRLNAACQKLKDSYPSDTSTKTE